jgi:hypothetical protein
MSAIPGLEKLLPLRRWRGKMEIMRQIFGTIKRRQKGHTRIDQAKKHNFKSQKRCDDA